MLLSIKRLQYFVLSLSCHGCLLKNKFLCLFLGRPAFMYPPPFFQWLYKTYFWQSLVLIVTLYMYLGKRPLNCSNISNQTKLILDYLYMHVKFWIWEKKIGLFVLQIQWIIKLEFILEFVLVILNIPLYRHSFC